MSKEIKITLEDLRHLFDLAVDSPTVCSGSFETDDVELLRKLARLIGVEPNKITPDEFISQYPHPFRKGVEPRWGKGYESPEQYQARHDAWTARVECMETRCGKSPEHAIHQWPTT